MYQSITVFILSINYINKVIFELLTSFKQEHFMRIFLSIDIYLILKNVCYSDKKTANQISNHTLSKMFGIE